MPDILYTNCSLATMQPGGQPYGLLLGASIALQSGHVAWLGKSSDVPPEFEGFEREDLGGRLVTPSLIDCHTHLVFGGNRAREFEMRLGGANYADIAKAGGGIVSTVSATRNASDAELINSALIRLDALISEGVAVVEIKSGYGLTIEDEMRMLKIARRLGELRPVKVVTTWLAAHAVPAAYINRADDYLIDVAIPGLKQAAAQGLVDAVDGFCENIAFSPAQIERVFNAAQELGLPVKLHAEQLSDQKGALLAAKYGALSADHLEYLPASDVKSFAASGTVAVILPGAFYCLGETQLPPIAAFRAHAVDMAVATDCNPGSSPMSSILTAMNMACTQFNMTPEEALTGTTRSAAKALGLHSEYGVIATGRPAHLAIWNAVHPAELSYWIGGSPLYKTISQSVTS